MKPLDLRFGNPDFLQELERFSYGGFISGGNANYSLTKVSDELKEAIYALHESIGNVKNPRDYQIVIGNGASQLLTALSKTVKIGVYAPYWSRFNNLIDDMQLFTKEWPHNSETHKLLVTYPNNPNGALSSKVIDAPAVDASYHWPMYYREGETLRTLDNDIILFSFSKLSGLSSARLGWALVKSPGIAIAMADQIEIATCGVNVLTQQVATEYIDEAILNRFEVMGLARPVLNTRLRILSTIYPEALTSRGMFLYANDPSDKLDKLNVLYYRGKIFGDSNDMVRLNIGCSTEDFNELVARLTRS